MERQAPAADAPRRRKPVRLAKRLAVAALALGLIVRFVRLAVNEPLWGDEAMLVRSLLDRNFAESIAPLDYVQLAPLGFLWLQTHCRDLFGTTDWVWRLIPFLAGSASLIAFARFSKRVVPRHAAWLATAIMASSLYLIRHSVEAKPYITDLAWSLSLTILGWSIQQEPDSVRRWVLFGVIAAIGVWCSFPCILVAGGVLVWLMPMSIFHRKTSLIPTACHIACGFAVLASFVGMYATFGRQQVVTAETAGYWQMSMWDVAYPPWQRPDQFAWWFLREHAGAMLAHPFGGKNFASLGTLLCVIVGLRVMWKRNPRLLVLLVMPAVMGLIAACLRKYPYGGTARTMLYLAPAICLLTGAGVWEAIVRWLPRSGRRMAFIAAMSACLALMIGRLALQIAYPYKESGDWQVRQTIQQWTQEASPEEIWIIGNAAATPEGAGRGIYGGVSVAVFDHYAITLRPQATQHPREITAFPAATSRVSVLIHESRLRPLSIDVAAAFREQYSSRADVIREDKVELGRGETLRRMIFVAKNSKPVLSDEESGQ